ncbi:hypothetical protein GCM10023353_38850 [Tomitella cavernea]|uniref:TraD/TraG TraM recognition site domain-containing protein n=1 Tax=Tomitella cavernea TaxID=1387982 RepID=A0ABP9D2D4_9ACTN
MSTPASRSEQQIMPIWFAPVATLLVGVVVAVVGGGVLAEVLSGVGVVWPPHGLVGVGQLLAGLVSSASDPGAAWAPHPSPGSPVIVWACIGVVGAVYTAAAISVAVWLSGRRMDRRHAREGFAGAAELRRRSLTEAKAREGGFAARVSLAGLPRHQRRQVPSSDLAVDVGHVVGAREHMWAQFRDGALVEGPTGSGKTWRIAWHRVIGAPGFCLATTTKPDLLWSTVAERAERGDVYVFDPENICAWPYRLRWSIIAGCDDPDTALRRAEALVQAMPIDDAKNGAYFTAKSIVLMRCYLYAAARLDASLRTLRTWASRRQVPEVREVLTRERPDWAAELEQTLGSSADSSEDIIGATSRLLEPLASPALMDALDVPVADSADLRSIIADGTNTLYLLSEGSSASAAPFVAALAAEVHHVAKQHALSLPGSAWTRPPCWCSTNSTTSRLSRGCRRSSPTVGAAGCVSGVSCIPRRRTRTGGARSGAGGSRPNRPCGSCFRGWRTTRSSPPYRGSSATATTSTAARPGRGGCRSCLPQRSVRCPPTEPW